MFKNYLKTIIRNIIRNKLYALVSITGLGIGIACCIYILLYVQYELSYDTYHKDAERIYRVAKSRKTKAKHELFATNVTEVATTLKENYPEVESAGLIGMWREVKVKYKDNMGIENGIRLADAGIFDIFSIKFIEGNPKTALQHPNNVVITKSIADRYFGNEEPVGKILCLDTLNCVVTSVIEDCPSNSHYKFTILKYLDRSEFIFHGAPFFPWGGWNGMNYIKLAPGVDFKKFEEKIRFLPHQYIGKELEKEGTEFTLFLQPITDIHLYSNLNWEAEPPGNPTYLYIFSAIGLFILLISCINFINLSTASSINRSSEVGIRKVAGARRGQIICQFILESLLISLASFILAVIIIDIALPIFNTITGINFTFIGIFQLKFLLILIGIGVLVVLVSGMYPALYISSYEPVKAIRGYRGGIGSKITIRKVLVVSQFVLSITLIIGTLTFYKQLSFMQNQRLGFDKEQKLIIEFNRSRFNPNTYQSAKNEFLNYPSIKGATFSSSVPGRWMYFWRMYPFGEKNTNNQAMNCFQVDYDFFKEYNIDVVAGRSFKTEMGTDLSGNGAIINEAAVKAFGWNSPNEALTKRLMSQNNKIIGVAKDFHYRGLQKNIDPVVIFLMTEDFRYITLNIDITNLKGTLEYVEKTYRKLCPDDPFQYFFLNEDFNKQYMSEQRLGKVFSIFTVLGIFIACLGLFGLSSFVIETRTKEIGIRKVLGSTVPQILFLISSEFIKLVLIGNIIAWPISYYIINQWLQNFAYKTDLNIWIFLVSAVVSFIIALLTIGIKAVRAATANPVDSLRYE